MIAWSFPEWNCRRCGVEVEWADAVAITDDGTPDGKLVAFRHVSCAEDLDD